MIGEFPVPYVLRNTDGSWGPQDPLGHSFGGRRLGCALMLNRGVVAVEALVVQALVVVVQAASVTAS